MDKNITHNLKLISDELANLLASGSTDKNKIEMLFSKLGFSMDNNKEAKIVPTSEKEDRVGIYIAKIIEGQKYYIKDKKFESIYDNWPKVENIPPKSINKRRVVFFGESVARGYLYEPYYSPSSVLEEVLNKSDNNVEVVDLAVTGIGPTGILDLCKSSLSLEPDTFVIFAGNNWKAFAFRNLSAIETLNVYKELATQKTEYEKVKAILDEGYKRSVDIFLKQLSEIVKGKKIEILFIIPEFNLIDYKSTLCEKGFSFLDDNTKEWIVIQKEAEIALNNERLESIYEFGNSLIKLNPFHVFGYELLGHYYLKKQKIEQARYYLELARDSTMFRINMTVPRILGVLREAIVEKAPLYNINVIRLDEIFKVHLKGALPDKSLFLDYCHLTIEGIEVSMCAAADALIKIWKKKDVQKENLKKYKLSTDKERIAVSHFFAALHNAHWGQPLDIVTYHIKESLKADKNNIVNILTSYLDLVTRKTPWLINKESAQILKSNISDHYGMRMILNSEVFKFNDVILVEAILLSLKDLKINKYENILRLREQEYGIGANKIDLLQTFYMANNYDKLISWPMPITAYYVERELISKFNFIPIDNSDLKMEITLRLPFSTFDRTAIIKINENMLSTIEVTSKWNDFSFEISSELLKEEINVLSILWPLPIKNIIKEEEVRIPNQNDLLKILSPIVGEIHSLHIEKLKKV